MVCVVLELQLSGLQLYVCICTFICKGTQFRYYFLDYVFYFKHIWTEDGGSQTAAR